MRIGQCHKQPRKDQYNKHIGQYIKELLSNGANDGVFAQERIVNSAHKDGQPAGYRDENRQEEEHSHIVGYSASHGAVMPRIPNLVERILYSGKQRKYCIEEQNQTDSHKVTALNVREVVFYVTEGLVQFFAMSGQIVIEK